MQQLDSLLYNLNFWLDLVMFLLLALQFLVMEADRFVLNVEKRIGAMAGNSTSSFL